MTAVPSGHVGAKEAMRREMKWIRRSIPAAERENRADRITDSVLSLTAVRRAAVVLAFASFGSEVPTTRLLSGLEEAGVSVLLPFLSSGEMFAAEHREGEPLVKSTYGPPEPLQRPVELSRIEAVVIPGLAFDRRGRRLGYGGGHYDRFLRRIPKDAVLVGIAFAEQLVEKVPTFAHDVDVELVVTDHEVVRAHER